MECVKALADSIKHNSKVVQLEFGIMKTLTTI